MKTNATKVRSLICNIDMTKSDESTVGGSEKNVFAEDLGSLVVPNNANDGRHITTVRDIRGHHKSFIALKELDVALGNLPYR